MSPEPTPPPPRNGLVTIVLPAKNEEAAIGRTIQSLPVPTLRALGLDTEIFVLDGQSHDATAHIARDRGAIVLSDPEPGKGSAIRHARRHFRGDYVVMLDADGTYAPDAIPGVLAPLARGEADVVLGRRIPLPGSMPPVNSMGNGVLSAVASLLYRRACPDVCTGLWGFRGEVLKALPLQSRGFGLEAELFALSARLGLRIAHTSVDYLPRQGEAKLHWARDGSRILRRIMRSRFAPLPADAARAFARTVAAAPTSPAESDAAGSYATPRIEGGG